MIPGHRRAMYVDETTRGFFAVLAQRPFVASEHLMTALGIHMYILIPCEF
jgi:hypothetical protein